MMDRNPRDAFSPTVPVLVCSLAILLLSVMDVAMKSLVLAIGVYNAVLWRSALASVAAGTGWLALRSGRPTKRNLRLHLLRATVIAVVLILFFWGLARLPLAEAIALSFIAPLVALFLAALLLGERIQRQAIWASVAGIGGVAIIMAGQIGLSEHSPDALMGTLAILASTGFYAYNLILARQQALLAEPLEIMFFQSIALVVLLVPAAPWLGAALPPDLWLVVGTVTALSLTGQFLMTWSYARAEAQYLIPTEYSAFVWAIAFGWLFFGEAVTWTTLVGGCLIIVGCVVAARSNPKLSEPIEATL